MLFMHAIKCQESHRAAQSDMLLQPEQLPAPHLLLKALVGGRVATITPGQHRDMAVSAAHTCLAGSAGWVQLWVQLRGHMSAATQATHSRL
jgi:hypothetical protein